MPMCLHPLHQYDSSDLQAIWFDCTAHHQLWAKKLQNSLSKSPPSLLHFIILQLQIHRTFYTKKIQQQSSTDWRLKHVNLLMSHDCLGQLNPRLFDQPREFCPMKNLSNICISPKFISFLKAWFQMCAYKTKAGLMKAQTNRDCSLHSKPVLQSHHQLLHSLTLHFSSMQWQPGTPSPPPAHSFPSSQLSLSHTQKKPTLFPR